MTTEHGVGYSNGRAAGGFTLTGARRLVAESLSRAGRKVDGRFRPAPQRVLRRTVGDWVECPEDQPGNEGDQA